ncbi:transporter, major facilitator family. narK is a member of this family [Candidatus Methylomirabilis lanthanidiphila]|uniref:Transporter, major facilitator family. narK is a member of this family n=1 Tax=Candidatus Methylomirabilis lanthanidiphila TaxID=2211376 RepID=A0A564ZHA4_9BACT|nr:MFS transporter [Candidatus Methylomirabilis lanthanidiphila]VUZ83928.1 transporter, major facilitator family. narK is a member of this family [Candidatus Methylomirabilis lanthanidiphila]
MRATFSPDQKRTIATLSVTIAIRMLGIFLVLPVFTLYGEQFTSSKPLIGLAFGSYGLTNALLQIPFGRLSDRFGRKPLLLIGLILHGVGSILAAVPPNIFALIAARLIQGTGAVSSVAFALVADSVDEKNRATAMAFLGASIGLSFVGGILIGPIIAGLSGYASLFWLSGLLSLLAAVYMAFAVNEPPRERAPTDVAADRLPVASVLKIPDIIRLDICGFLTSFFMSSFFFYFPLLARPHLPLQSYYLLLGPMLLAGMTVMFAASRAADRGWAKSTGVTAFVVLLISGWLLFRGANLESQAHPLLLLTIAGIFFFVGFSSLEPILPSLITKASPKGMYGTALGTYSSLQFLGSFAGGATAGFLSTLGTEFVMAALLIAAASGIILMAQVQRT